MNRSLKYGSNFWTGYSPKIKREVHFYSDLEYDHWILVETNPNIVSFCEQPIRIEKVIGGERAESIFDMWIKCRNGEESFVEVKYSKELDPNSIKSLRTLRQIEIQRLWCEENYYKYSVQTEKEIRGNQIFLANQRIILPYINNRTHPIDLDHYQILKIINEGRILLKEIEQRLPTIPSARIREAIYLMIYHGKIQANINQKPLGAETEVWLHA